MSTTQANSAAALERSLNQRRSRGYARDTLARLRHIPGAMLGLALLLLLIAMAIFAPLLTPYDISSPDLRASLSPPNSDHWFGTDDFGRDIFTRVLYGGRISLTVGLIALAIGAGLGTLIGLVSGFYGRRIDAILMWFIDVLLAFPGILLALLVVSILGVELRNVMLAVGVSMIPRFARLVRGTVLSARENLYVDAARVIGVPESRVLVRHVLPNVISSVIVLSTLSLGTAIIIASGLSFLGLGAKPPSPEWGAMLSDGRQFIQRQWWIATFPGVAILLTVIAVNLIGDGLRDALDPRMKT
jgi:peptide/nickel transport system permease protein